jgi:glutamyl-tRNA reductase
MRRREIGRALAAIERGDDPKKVLEQFSQALTNKFLHAPTSTLNQAEAVEREQLMRALARLHRIDLGE